MTTRGPLQFTDQQRRSIVEPMGDIKIDPGVRQQLEKAANGFRREIQYRLLELSKEDKKAFASVSKQAKLFRKKWTNWEE